MRRPLELEDSRSILNAFRHMVQAIHVSSKTVESKLKISGAQLFVLRKINESMGCSINELADKTLTHQSSVSVVVARLAKKSLIKRRSDPTDRRRSIVEITDAGRKLLKRAPHTPQDRLAKAIMSMPDYQRKILSSMLSDLMRSADLQQSKTNLFFEDKKPKIYS